MMRKGMTFTIFILLFWLMGTLTAEAEDTIWRTMSVDQEKTFTVEFSEKMDEGSVKERIQVRKKGEVVDSVIEVDEYFVKVSPETEWETNTRYELSLPTGIQSVKGMSTKETVVVPFEVEKEKDFWMLSMYGEEWELRGLDEGNFRYWNDGTREREASYVWREGEVYRGVEIGSHRLDVREVLGEPLEVFERGTRNYKIEDRFFEVFRDGGNEITVFYDQFNSDKVRAVYSVPVNWVSDMRDYYSSEAYWRPEDQSLVMYGLMNKERVQRGMEPLEWNGDLSVVALKHSEDMVERGYFAHESPEGASVSDRVERHGLTYSVVGENLAYGQANAVYAHEGLMNSEGHRKNILKEDYKEVGVAVERTEKGVPYFTIVFYSR